MDTMAIIAFAFEPAPQIQNCERPERNDGNLITALMWRNIIFAALY